MCVRVGCFQSTLRLPSFVPPSCALGNWNLSCGGKKSYTPTPPPGLPSSTIPLLHPSIRPILPIPVDTSSHIVVVVGNIFPHIHRYVLKYACTSLTTSASSSSLPMYSKIMPCFHSLPPTCMHAFFTFNITITPSFIPCLASLQQIPNSTQPLLSSTLTHPIAASSHFHTSSQNPSLPQFLQVRILLLLLHVSQTSVVCLKKTQLLMLLKFCDYMMI